MGKFAKLGNELYTGKKSIDFIGRRWLWYSVSGVIVLAGDPRVDGQGPQHGHRVHRWRPVHGHAPGDAGDPGPADELRDAVSDSGIDDASSPIVTTQGSDGIVVQTEPLTTDEATEITGSSRTRPASPMPRGHLPEGDRRQLGRRGGRALGPGLVVFLILVVLFIWAYFRQWKMSIAALVALVHDVLITIGVYALSGFEVTPATVTGLLTILGFSLYDTVVVFDKVRENTKNLRSTRMTYAGAANLAVNQTLVRSINTSIVALIPVGAILYVERRPARQRLAQGPVAGAFVGTAAGVYSSVFIATPLLAHLKQGETEVVLAERRAKARAKQADRYASVPVFTDDLPVSDTATTPTTRTRSWTTRAPSRSLRAPAARCVGSRSHRTCASPPGR